METNKKEILNILPLKVREVLKESIDISLLEEIRLRCNKPVFLVGGGKERTLKRNQNEIIIDENDIKEAMGYISGYSMYAFEEQLKEGFITIRGGHRVGVSGKIVLEKESIKTVKNIASVNIRVSHEVIGCSDDVIDYVKGNTLIISPPRMGKTTLLRDILRHISDKEGQNVGIVDERSEIAACYMGIPQNDVGKRSDVLDCCPKSQGMLLLLRAMSPTYIGVDELGTKSDIEAVLQVVNSGAGVIATIHGEDLEEIRKKELTGRLIREKVFDTYIVLSRTSKKVIKTIFDKDCNLIC